MHTPLQSLLVGLLLLLATTAGGATEYLMVEVRRGDGIYSLLRRYQLVDYACNITEFRRLNYLNPNSKLLVGRQYKLPVEVLAYDGESIRTTTRDDNWDRAVAIKEYNSRLLALQLRSKDYRDDGILYLPHHIDHCSPFGAVTPTLSTVRTRSEPLDDRPPVDVPEQPTTAAPRTFTIFGEKYAKVPLLDRSLTGRIFYIVAGHGGPDPGAIGRRSGHVLAEDEYAYDVALRLARNILERGGTPYMIVRDENDGIRDERYLKADKDEVVWGGGRIPRNQKLRLFQRSDLINALYDENMAKGITDQTMIAIHVDSRQRGQQVDVYLYFPEGDVAGAHRARRISDTFRDKYNEYRPGRGYDGTVRSRDLHMLRETKLPGVYIELANIANSSDQVRIVSPANRQLLADWLLQGLYD